MRSRIRQIAIAVAGLAVIASCGSGESSPVAADKAPKPITLPAVDVRDILSGETVSVASLVPSDRPVLLWFWAPH